MGAQNHFTPPLLKEVVNQLTMAFYQISSVQNIPASIDEVWDYFTSHKNLKKITPPDMGFDITSQHPEGIKVYPGMIITYKVRPLFGIPVSWMTEITQVKEKEYFIDEQRFGPYAMWHHQHFFKPIEGGVEMTDIVDYKLPLGILGDIAHPILVKNRLKQIFDYRFKKVEEIFGVYNNPQRTKAVSS